MSECTEYGFAVGRVRTLEQLLLDQNRYARLTKAQSPADLLALLSDTYYGRFFSTEDNEKTFGAVLAAAAGENLRFFERYCLDSWLLKLIRLRTDFHNLKVSVKGQLAGIEADPSAIIAGGDWDQDQLAALSTGAPGAEPEEVAGELTAIVHSSDPNPAFVDAELDRLLHQISLDLAGPSGFLHGYLSLVADVENLRTLVRVKTIGDDRTALETAYLAGGTIDLSRLTALLAEEWDAVVQRFRLTPFARMVEEGIGEIRTSSSAVRLERLGREIGLGYLRRSRYAVFGHEPLVCYYLLRDNEAVNLRRLAAAKAAGIDEAGCRELVAYVD